MHGWGSDDERDVHDNKDSRLNNMKDPFEWCCIKKRQEICGVKRKGFLPGYAIERQIIRKSLSKIHTASNN